MMSELNDDVITSDISNDVIDLSNDISNDVTDTSDVTKDVPKNVPSDVSPDRGKRPLPDADSDSTLPQVPSPKRLKELCPILKKSENFGICEYVSKAHDGFYGVLKHRISDFIVNEIDADSKVLKLTDMSVHVEEVKNGEDPNDPESHAKLKSLVGEEVYAKMQDLIKLNTKKAASTGEEGDEEAPAPPREISIPAPAGRDARAQIHGVIRNAFPALESQTDDVITASGEAFEKVIKIKLLADCFMKGKPKGKARGFLHPGGKRVEQWPRNRPEFLYFVLYKENTDTMDAINVLAGNLGLKTGSFVFSGTKDKRGITTQQVTVQKVNANKLLSVNPKLKCIKVGNCCYRSQALRLGDNWGNQFRIVLRNLKSAEKQAAAAAMASLAQNGFINYYGMQRFGSTDVSTHSVGIALLRKEWKTAVELILKPRPNDRDDMQDCRKTWETTRDPQAALDKLNRRKCPERALLSGLLKHAPKNDFCGALNWIARTTRLMYVHAYQSYIWNVTVSMKVAKHGLTPQIGDLVATRTGADKILTSDVSVLQTDADIARHTVYDVILPLVGHDVIFPENESKDWMETIFTADGLSIESFNSSVRDYALPGGYRHVLVKPKDMEWNFLEYGDENEPLNILDEAEIIKSDFMVRKEEAEAGQPTRLAMRMKFSLPSSCYATMAIREVIRMDVSSGFQATLNTISN